MCIRRRASDMTVRDAFNRVGADEWDALRTRFRETGAAACGGVVAEVS